MWNLISCNKLTEQRIRQRSYDKHVSKINKMKPQMTMDQPEQPWFVYAKKKKQLSRNQQLMNIEKQNHLLLSKIKIIESRENQKFIKPSFLTTLNSKIMNQTNVQIFKENKRICQRIMGSETFYKTTNILQKSNNLERVMQNISMNARRVQSAKSLLSTKMKIARPLSSSLQRPQSSFHLSQRKQRIQSAVTNQNSHSHSHRLFRPSSAPSIKRFRIKSQKKQIQEHNFGVHQ